jgi:hypothetical protein
MDIVGYVALGVVAAGVLAAVVVLLTSLSDVRRYKRIRRM